MLWTEAAELADSATDEADDLKREDRRVSRPPDAEAPEAEAPPEAPLPPPTKLPGVLPVLRLLLLPQES